MEKKQEQENSGFQPKRRNPEQETVCYKIGGTVYEVSTSCGGTGRMQDKLIRLMKSESGETPNDK